jgi:hypothetical protein
MAPEMKNPFSSLVAKRVALALAGLGSYCLQRPQADNQIGAGGTLPDRGNAVK